MQVTSGLSYHREETEHICETMCINSPQLKALELNSSVWLAAWEFEYGSGSQDAEEIQNNDTYPHLHGCKITNKKIMTTLCLCGETRKIAWAGS